MNEPKIPPIKKDHPCITITGTKFNLGASRLYTATHKPLTTPAKSAPEEMDIDDRFPCVVRKNTPTIARIIDIISIDFGNLLLLIQVTIKIKIGAKSCKIVPIAAVDNSIVKK